jgi:glycosyltransferase involved in cell wall biosynthesis
MFSFFGAEQNKVKRARGIFMSRKLLGKLIVIDAVLLLLVLCYIGFLFLTESDYRDNNYNNIQAIGTLDPEEQYSFTVFGSAENSIAVFQKEIIPQMNADSRIRFAVSTGNAVLDGAEAKYRILNRALKKLNVPCLIGVGNSEISDGGDRAFYRHYGPFYFSFSVGDSYFIFLDTTGKTAPDLQEGWLTGELQKAQPYRHKFVFMNDSPVVEGDHYISDKDFREFLIDNFSVNGVTCVFTNGSAYTQNTVNGVTYYSSGGAGGLLPDASTGNCYYYLTVNVSADSVTVEQIREPWISDNPFIHGIENMLNFIYSIFYAQYLNLLLIISLLLLLFLILYKFASKETNYYRDFSETSDHKEKRGQLNIAMFTNNYLPFIGGVPISIHRLANALRKRGNRVVIFAPAYPEEDDSEPDVVRCKPLFYRKGKKFVYSIADISSPVIEKNFLEGHFDVIHVHHPFWLGRKGLRLGQKYHIPVVLTYHTRFEMYADYLPFFRTVFKNRLSHWLIKGFAQECDTVIAPTTTVKEYLENVGVSRPKLVLPTGVDFSGYQFIEEPVIGELKKQYAPNNEVLLCSVSRLAPEKNLGFLITGLKLVKEKTAVRFKFILIGNGPEREHLQKLIDLYSLRGEVQMVGSVAPEDLPMYYLASDLFVFCSKSETQGMVLLEAMAGKCPVVCVRSSGTDDVIVDAYNGFKIPEDVEKWAGKVIELLEDKEMLKTMQKNASIYVQEFSIEKMAEKVEDFYWQTITSRKVFPNKQ